MCLVYIIYPVVRRQRNALAPRSSEVVGFNAAMSAWAQGGHWQQVLHLLRSLRCRCAGGRAEHLVEIYIHGHDYICIGI